MSRHIIHKQQITLNLPKQEGAYAFQNRVSALLHNELTAGIETVFDELFPDGGDVIRIDSLKLDLGNISPQNFEQEFKEHFIQELRKNLSAKKDIVSDTDNEEILTPAQSLTGALIYFLENGYLPWYSSVEKITDWEDEILKSFSGKRDHRFFSWLSDNYKDNPVVLQRLIMQFTDGFLEQVLLALAPAANNSLPFVYHDLHILLNSCKKGDPQLRTAIWKSLFRGLLNDPDLWNKDTSSGADNSGLVFRILQLLTDHFCISGTDINKSIKAGIGSKLKTNLVKNAFQKLMVLRGVQDNLRQKNGDNIIPGDQKNTEMYHSDKPGNDYHEDDQKSTITNRSDQTESNYAADDQKSKESNYSSDQSENDNAADGQKDKENNHSDQAENAFAADDRKDEENSHLNQGENDYTTDDRKDEENNHPENAKNHYAADSRVHQFDNEEGDLKDSVNEPDKADKYINKNIPADNLAGDTYKNGNKEKAFQSESSKNKKQNDIPGIESLFIKNSGIVMLHYFLKPFFTDLKLLNDNDFIDDVAHQRAVLLLHYLATGNTEVAEFDLTLQKILCGYPLNETLPVSINLSRKEKKESKKLLTAVVAHWAPMKNTSANGLRSAFLARDGKLTTKENGWLLTVEQRTIDVLLGKLPWGFSTIRLPWMQQILNVDWY